MSFTLSVHRVADQDFFDNVPADVRSDEFDQWFDECRRRTLFDAPVAGHSDFFSYWNEPARRLGLPLIGGIYSSGLQLAGDALGDLAREVARLEQAWLTLVPDDAWNGVVIGKRQFRVPKLVHLFDRSANVAQAIRIAQLVDGVIEIS
jgi:hypothetical protein